MSSPPTGLRRVVAASMARTVVGMGTNSSFDGTVATLAFSKVFFPKGGNDLYGLILRPAFHHLRRRRCCRAPGWRHRVRPTR